MAKFLRVTMPDSTVWDIAAELIALRRTEYYSAGRGKSYKDGKLVWQEPSFDPGSKEWNEEFKQSMKDYELTDWASNNMAWKDVRVFAIQVPQKVKPKLYDDAWPNAEKKIVQKEALPDVMIGPGPWAREHLPKDTTMEALRKALEEGRKAK